MHDAIMALGPPPHGIMRQGHLCVLLLALRESTEGGPGKEAQAAVVQQLQQLVHDGSERDRERPETVRPTQTEVADGVLRLLSQIRCAPWPLCARRGMVLVLVLVLVPLVSLCNVQHTRTYTHRHTHTHTHTHT